MAKEKPSRDDVRREIDNNIKRIYQQTLEEDIPDRFKDLLSKLKEQETRQ